MTETTNPTKGVGRPPQGAARRGLGQTLASLLGMDEDVQLAFLEEEKARLEAVLNAAPEPFCGWAPSGYLALAPDFPLMLGVERIRTLDDVCQAIGMRHAQPLRQAWSQLETRGTGFSLIVDRVSDGTLIRLRGGRGSGFGRGETFHVLWASLALPEKVGKQPRFIDSDLRNQLIPALNHVAMPVWLRDRSGALLWVNQAYADALEASIDQCLEEQLMLAGTIVQDLAARALDASTPQIQRHAVTIRGERRHLELHESFLKGPEFAIGYALDRSDVEQAVAEGKLRSKSHARVLERLAAGILIFDNQQRLTFHNLAFCRLTKVEEGFLERGPSLGEVLDAMRQRQALPEVMDFRAFKRGHEALFTSLIDPQEEVLHLIDGRSLRQIISPHEDDGLVYTFEDVTGQMKLERDYNTLIKVQQETLANLSEGTAVFGTNGLLALHNPAFREIWKLSEAQLSDKPHVAALARRMTDATDPGAVGPDLGTLMTEMVIGGLETHGDIHRPDGPILRYRSRPLPDGGMLISFIDITDSVRVEQALKDKTEALMEADRLKADFLANVSYKLRTPLNTIVGYSELLDQGFAGALSPKQSEHMRDILSAGAQLMGLINDILDMATLEAGYLTLKQEPTDIAALMASVEELSREWAGTHDLKVSFDVDPAIGSATLDGRRVKQALLNLISNAIKFTQPGGTISVRAQRGPETVRFVVSDSGIGIPGWEQDRVFNLFYQSGDARRAATEDGKDSGSGLGLPLVKRLVEMHGGTVSLRSEPQRGTSVRLEIPV